ESGMRWSPIAAHVPIAALRLRARPHRRTPSPCSAPSPHSVSVLGPIAALRLRARPHRRTPSPCSAPSPHTVSLLVPPRATCHSHAEKGQRDDAALVSAPPRWLPHGEPNPHPGAASIPSDT